MAIDWGSWETSGSNGMRVGIDVSWGSNAHTVSSITATVRIYTQNIQNYSDNQTLTYGGSISGTTDYNNSTGSASGTTSNPDTARLRATKTYTWPYAPGNYMSSPSTRTFTATVSGAFNGVTPSNSVSSAVPAREGTTPGAIILTSTPGNNTVYISISHAGTPEFEGYTNTVPSFEYSEDSFTFTTISGYFPYPIAGTNGTSKTIWVRARNVYGPGPVSSTTNTPRTTPGKPGVSSSPANGSISVSYSAPASDGGNGIGYYQYSPTNADPWTTTPSNPFSINGSNGTAITIYVRAVNDAGAGGSESTSSTPRTTPGAPSVSSTPTNGSVSISYGAPASDGGNAISSYQYSTDNANWTTTPSNPFSINGANGTAITIYVRAVNAAGGGTSASATSTPRTTPSAPTSFAGNNSTFGQIALSWGAPSSNGGNAVTSYVLRNDSTVLQSTGATSYTHTGLSPYTDYSYTVTAVNAAGEGTQASLTIKSLGGIAKIWNGTSWVTTLPKIWNGTAWVDAQARMWDGTEWKHGI